MLRITSVILCVFLLSQKFAMAQGQIDSARKIISALTAAQKSNKLADTLYLNEMYGNMRGFLSSNIFFTNKELLQLLKPYKQVALKTGDKKYLRLYYAMLSNQAQMTGRYGVELYYAEKIDLLEQETNGRPSLAALSIIMDYYLAHQAPQKTIDVYLKQKAYLQTIPKLIHNSALTVNDAVQSVIVFEKAANALYKIKDTMEGNEAQKNLLLIVDAIKIGYPADANIRANVRYLEILTSYHKASGVENPALYQACFRQLEKLLTDTTTPGYLKQYIGPTLLDWKLAYHLHYKNSDSAKHYLSKYEQSGAAEGNPYNQFLLQKQRAQLYYNEGAYQKSADEFLNATLTLDSARSTLIKDVDEMLYAQAKAEEQQLLLDEANQKRNSTEKQLLIAGIIIATLVISGIFILQYNRRKQRNKFIDFKLNMARNIHDETGPALLYARTLAKAYRTKQLAANNSELEKQIERTMEVIRHLSHDLKSDRLMTLSDLSQQTRAILDKLNPDNEFAFSLTEDIDKKQFISHLQFTQIRAILNECITNTIKHADFRNISIALWQKNNKFTITYQDDGKGWETRADENGIGIKNMEERVVQLNGTFKLDNRYPYGYCLKVTVTLRCIK